MKNLKINEMAEELRKKFEEFKLKAELSYTTDTIMVNWYVNDYDYNKMSFRYDKEDYTVDDYFALIVSTFNDHLQDKEKSYIREYKARPEKRFLVDLIKYYNCEDFLFVHSDDLHSDEFENNYVPIDDIVNFQYSPIGDKLILQEDQCGDEYYYTIDFKNKTIDTRVEELELDI